ncbi:MAG: hypothetical protein HY901_25300, partial [Deltaproteobacteria bacterium]|nr:hypothetical protein [Deltaproteobacteria bacterium]
MRQRHAALLVLGTLAVAFPAQAGWQRARFLDAPAGNEVLPPQQGLKAVGAARPAAGQPAMVWAVGGSQTLNTSLIVHSTDDFHSLWQSTQCSSIAHPLNALWVAPDASFVHAFGRSFSHAAFDGTWACTPYTVSASGLFSNFAVLGVSFADRDNGYLGGSATQMGSTHALVQWTSSGATKVGGYSNVAAVARSASGSSFFSTGNQLNQVGVGPVGTVVSNPINALAFHGDSGLLVTNVGNDTRFVNGGTGAVTTLGVAPSFSNAKGVALAATGFAVVVTAATATTGAIYESYDGGHTWRAADLTGIAPAVRALAAVSCWDENTCAAVGANDLGAGLFEPEFLFYENLAPTAVVTVNGQPLSVHPRDDAPICLAAAVTDPEGDPDLTITWHGAGVDASPLAVPPCFSTGVSCSPQSLDYTLDLSDGRRTAVPSPTFQVVVDHAPQPPSAPTLSP